VENVEQIANLALMRGMVGKRAAGLLPLRGHSNVQGIGTIGVKPVLAEDVMQAMERHFNIPLPKSPGLDTMSAMMAAHAGDIDLALIMGGNLFSSNPDSRWAAQALGNIKTKVFLTTTLNRGHLFGAEDGESLILPVTARDEEWQATTQESMFNFVRLSDGGIERLSATRPESTIICELAKRTLTDCPVDFTTFESHQHIREAIAAILPDMAALATIDEAKKEFHIQRRILHEPVFSTADCRATFAPACHRRKPEGTLTLSTVRSEGQFNSIVYEDEDVYRGTTHRWCVMMSPSDMSRLNLKRGDRVTLKSETGEMKDVESVPFDLPEGNLMCYYPEANCLTSTEVDPRSRTPAFKATTVEVISDTA
jgi:anaerobic selenocysteine-containing dehydrogenase